LVLAVLQDRCLIQAMFTGMNSHPTDRVYNIKL